VVGGVSMGARVGSAGRVCEAEAYCCRRTRACACDAAGMECFDARPLKARLGLG
jgi:3-methyladenine DNA glycosylase Mpg